MADFVSNFARFGLPSNRRGLDPASWPCVVGRAP